MEVPFNTTCPQCYTTGLYQDEQDGLYHCKECGYQGDVSYEESIADEN